VEELQAEVEFFLAVLPQAPTFLQPAEGPFHYPSFGQDDKREQFIAFLRPVRWPQSLFYAVCKWLSGVASIDQVFDRMNSLR
jgi:hypothetical protein